MGYRVRRWKVLLAGPLVALPLAGVVGVLLLDLPAEASAESERLAAKPVQRRQVTRRRVQAPPPPVIAAPEPVRRDEGPAPLEEPLEAPLAPEEQARLSGQAADAESGLGDRVGAIAALERAQGGSAQLLASLAKLDPEAPSSVTIRPVLLASLIRSHDDAPAQARLLEALSPKSSQAERLLLLSAAVSAVRPKWLLPHLERLSSKDDDPKVRARAQRTLELLSERAIARR